MNFEVLTLIDITETGARFDKVDPLWLQQQNYMTFVQTLGLRVNPYITSTKVITDDITGLGFGTIYKGKQKVWKVDFNVEYEGGITTDDLVNDFHLVPVINNLDETIKLKDCMFDSKNPKTCNIIFKCVD